MSAQISLCSEKFVLNILQVIDDVQNENQKTVGHKKENLNLLDQLIKEQPGLSKPEGLNPVQRRCSDILARN